MQVDVALMLLCNIMLSVSAHLLIVLLLFAWITLPALLWMSCLFCQFVLNGQVFFLFFQDTKDSYIVSPEIWDLRVFKRLPSMWVIHIYKLTYLTLAFFLHHMALSWTLSHYPFYSFSHNANSWRCRTVLCFCEFASLKLLIFLVLVIGGLYLCLSLYPFYFSYIDSRN